MRLRLARPLLALPPLLAIAGIAAAEPSLKCNYAGRKTTVVIVNSDTKDMQCNYHCAFSLEGGSRQISGSTGVKAGETKVADEGESRYDIKGVESSKLECK
jgi:hypothetical protein